MRLFRRRRPSKAERALGAVRGAARMMATASALRFALVGAATLVGLTTASAAVSSARGRQEDDGAESRAE
jgi:hypothetical protein